MTGENRADAPRASLNALLRFAWDAELFVVADAMQATGLTRSTTIDAIDELVSMGLVRELPNARSAGEYSKGRPSRRFELREDAAVVIGVDAGRSHLTAIVADLRGRVLACERMELGRAQDTPEARRGAIIMALDSALAAAGSSRAEVLAACIGVPAPVNDQGDSPRHVNGFWQRMNPDLLGLLSEWVPIVRVINDASLAAVAEGSVGRATGLLNYVVLLAGDRFGAGVVIDGHLLRGHHGAVGEMRAFDHVKGVDSVEGVGLRLADWAREDLAAGVVPATSQLATMEPASVSGRTILRLARDGDTWAQSLRRRAGTLLARVAIVFSNLYDPSRIIVAGAVADDLDEVLKVARDHLPAEWELPVPELERSHLGADAVVTGAVSAARGAARAGVLRLNAAEMRRLQLSVKPPV